MLLLTDTLPTIVVVVIATYAPQTKCTIEEHMLIPIGIETVRKMYAIVSTTISIIECGYTKVKVIAISITFPDAHSPCGTRHIDGAIEVVALDKLTILTIA